MAGFWDRMVGRTLGPVLDRLGYGKATDFRPVLAGETPIGQTLNTQDWKQERWERLALTSSWVFSDIDLISGIVANTPIGVYRREGEDVVEEVNHPFEQLLMQPYPFWPRGQFLQYTGIWDLLRGEAYWLKGTDLAGELTGLLPVPADRMTPIPSASDYIGGFAYQPKVGTRPTILAREDVVYFRRPNPFNFHRGMSPLTAYRVPMLTDIEAAQWNLNTFKKQATLRTLISLSKDLSSKVYGEAKREIIHDLMEERKRYLVARADQVSVQALGMSPQDMEYLKGREFTREEIDRVFKVPAGFWAKDANRANADAARASLIEYAVWPMLTRMADTITEQVVRPHYGSDLVAQFDDIRVTDRKLELAERRQATGTQTVNEARAARGEGEYDGPMAEVIGGLLVPLGTDSTFVMAMIKGGMVVDGEDGDDAGVDDEMSDDDLDTLLKAAMLEDLRRWRSVARRLEGEGKSAAGYDFESKHISAGLAGCVKAGIELVGAESAFRFLKAAGEPGREVEGRLDRIVRQVLKAQGIKATDAIEAGQPVDFEALRAALRAALQPELEGIATEEMLRSAAAVGVEFDPAMINAEAAAWADVYTFELVQGLTDTTRKVVQQAIKQFIETAGMTRGTLEGLLVSAFGPGRASMIAVTEVTRAYSAATNRYRNLLDAEGVVMEEVWNTREDELVCPICGPLDGTTDGEWDERFPNGPPAHPNCRCFTTLRFVGSGQ